ncbi:O-antigen ligase family protein [Aristaeella lactis]|uniref:O-antigen ligase n=1 Tax=Aristaeella lactis TaxID=3046383 RepID=A0AC61PJB9_9FIRM|nr:O-antigen ligase family protein [Aristaeella lactis]QUA54042.1 hypothetical protein JYE50_05320 [Aristaeella lactis]SMC42689.1 O-antigen ligase [Aristaeella lactis]
MGKNYGIYVNNSQSDNHSKYIIIPDSRSSELTNTLLVFFLMFFSNDTYLFGSNKNTLFVSLPRYILLLFCLFEFVYFLRQKSIQKHKKQLVMYCIMLVTFIVISLINKELINRTINKMLFMSGGLFVCILLSFKDYSKAFRNSILLISISSTVLWILSYLIPDLVLQLPRMENTAGVKFATIIFAGLDISTIYSPMIRTFGIFWEPGVFQMFINLAILFELFVENRPRRVYLIVYCIALLSTFSTTGYIAFLWIVLIYILFGGKNTTISKANRWFIILPILLIILLQIITRTSIGQKVFGKANNLKEGTTMVRFASFFASISIARSHPLTGVGMENVGTQMYTITKASDLYFGWTSQNTNTFLYQFAAHGCIFGGLFLIGSSLFGRVFHKGALFTFSVFILLIIFYIGENYLVSMVPYVFIFYGFESERTEDMQKSEEYISNERKTCRYFVY